MVVPLPPHVCTQVTLCCNARTVQLLTCTTAHVYPCHILLQGAMQTAVAEKGHTRQSFNCHNLLKHVRDTILCALRPPGPLLPCLLEKRTLKLRLQGRTSVRLARWLALRGINT